MDALDALTRLVEAARVPCPCRGLLKDGDASVAFTPSSAHDVRCAVGHAIEALPTDWRSALAPAPTDPAPALLAALRVTRDELEQLHAHFYKECHGIEQQPHHDCPPVQAIRQASTAIAAHEER